MNGGSTSKRTPPQRQLPRMILLIHDSQQSPINSQLVEVADYNILRRGVMMQRTAALPPVGIRRFPNRNNPSTLGQAGCGTRAKKLTYSKVRPGAYPN